MEIVLSSASHHAMLFAYIVKETIEAFGEDGKTVISEAVNLYGSQRGKRMAERARADGYEPDVISYFVYSEWEAFPGQVERDFTYAPEVHMQYYRCPWHTEWKTRGLLEYGRYYCRYVDEALIRGFNENLEIETITNRSLGHDCCDFVFPRICVPKEQEQELEARKERLGKAAVMPWEYHVGHLYRVMNDKILGRFGKAGERVMKRAMKAYAKEYGVKAKELVLEYGELDFTVTPPYNSNN